MKKLTIKSQIISGFVAVLALMVALASVAIYRVSIVDANLEQINEVNSVKQRYAINFRGSVHDRAIALRDVVLVENARELDAAIAEIRQLEAMYAESAAPLDAMLAPERNPSAQELEILNAIKATEARTNPLIEEVISRHARGDEAGAMRVLLTEARPQFITWLGQINQFIDLEEARNKELAAETRSETGNFTWVIALLCLGATIIGVGVIVWATKSVRQIPEVADVIEKLSNGERNITIPCTDLTNEVGQVARSTQSLRDQLKAADRAKDEQVNTIVETVGTGLERLASGDLTARVTADLEGPFAKLESDFNKAVSSLEDTVAGMAGAAANTNTGAREVRAASDDLSTRTEQQAASLEETAASMGQVTELVKRTATNADDARKAIEDTDARARDGGATVKRAVEAMSSIEQSSNDITPIIDVIDGIAFQTNLLALNAGVEAARAGEAGKGFAVVANEVRALAQRSAEAASEIKELISKSSKHVGDGVHLVGQAGDLLQTIVDQISGVTAQVNDIAQMANSQSTNLDQVNASVSEMDRMTQQNAAMVEETTAAARSLSNEAEQLEHMVERFKTTHDGRTIANSSASIPMAASASSNAPSQKMAEPPLPKSAASKSSAAIVAGNLALSHDQDLEDDDQDWSEF
ncbi:MAG: methyl-accepting chemotaxis protein [Pseudomonadota bacterium]